MNFSNVSILFLPVFYIGIFWCGLANQLFQFPSLSLPQRSYLFQHHSFCLDDIDLKIFLLSRE